MNLLQFLNPLTLYRKRGRILPAMRGEGRKLRLAAAARGLPGTAWRRRLGEKQRALEALRGRHTGRRIFVIGNGPSLTMADLDRLQGEVSIASNKIYLAFGQTRWRPDYLTVADMVVAENNRAALDALELTRIVDLPMRTLLDDGADYLYYRLGPAGDGRGAPFRFSDDCARVIHGGYSVTYVNLQLAAWMGASAIYLIGLDFHFEIPERRIEDREFGFKLVSGGERNHFTSGYRPAGEVWTMPRLDLQRMAFERARAHLDARGIPVYNASRRTALDVFERAALDDVLAGGDSSAAPGG